MTKSERYFALNDAKQFLKEENLNDILNNVNNFISKVGNDLGSKGKAVKKSNKE